MDKQDFKTAQYGRSPANLATVSIKPFMTQA
jgi:hypothetical protein